MRAPSRTPGRCHGVLFDLDGTLIDTAPDMVAVLQDLQRDSGIEPVEYLLGRSHVSNGALGLIRLGFPGVSDADSSQLHQRYLERYAAQLCRESAVFPALAALLDELDASGRPWGVVTNKPGHLTNPLLERLALASRCACAVSGDTVSKRKPDPAPLLHACEVAGLDPLETVYVGDAARDIEAGRRAGMLTIAAAYGYVTDEDDPATWGADVIVHSTEELAACLRRSGALPPP